LNGNGEIAMRLGTAVLLGSALGLNRLHHGKRNGLAITNLRGVIRIAHGLGEHIGRYADLADFLVEDQFVVYGNDHRGHGLTAKHSDSFGEFWASRLQAAC
jgi:alpha-beta hydrolase superfamily lysophospholipase